MIGHSSEQTTINLNDAQYRDQPTSGPMTPATLSANFSRDSTDTSSGTGLAVERKALLRSNSSSSASRLVYRYGNSGNSQSSFEGFRQSMRRTTSGSGGES